MEFCCHSATNTTQSTMLQAFRGWWQMGGRWQQRAATRSPFITKIVKLHTPRSPFTVQKLFTASKTPFSCAENGVFQWRKRYRVAQSCLWRCCHPLRSRSPPFRGGVRGGALLPPATHLPPPSICLIYSGLSTIGGRVAAKRVKN